MGFSPFQSIFIFDTEQLSQLHAAVGLALGGLSAKYMAISTTDNKWPFIKIVVVGETLGVERTFA
jgi:hypothetical protein